MFMIISIFYTNFIDLEGGKFFFNTVREGDSVLFATEDEQEAHNWVMAFYRYEKCQNLAKKCQILKYIYYRQRCLSENAYVCIILNF